MFNLGPTHMQRQGRIEKLQILNCMIAVVGINHCLDLFIKNFDANKHYYIEINKLNNNISLLGVLGWFRG